MERNVITASGHGTATMYDNLIMTGPAGTPRSPLRRWLTAPFSRRAWAEVRYTFVTLPLSVASFVFAVVTIGNGPLRPAAR
jgi:hypothetical protein